MKFVPNRDLDFVTSALNLETPDLRILGGCDLYTTKAAGTDKKLYKNIENGLEAQHQAKINLSHSMSPPQVEFMKSSLNLSRSSPFGNLGKVSSRRTYAYLIATLNASHPDYDFSNNLRPGDFKRERSLRSVINNIDTTLYNLRPRPVNTHLMVPGTTPSFGPTTQNNWGPAMWGLVDKQMSLRDCAIYRYEPDDFDPFEDDEDGSIWSINYFFFNKARKRVCYLYLRGISVLSTSDTEGLMTPMNSERLAEDASEWLIPEVGAEKRASYWLGDRDPEDVKMDDLEDVDQKSGNLPVTSDEEAFSPPARPVVDEHENYLLSDEEMRSVRSMSKSTTRGMSEEVVGHMEV